MSTHAPVQIVAMADLFREKLDWSKKVLNEQNLSKGFSAIPSSATYVGPDAYEQLLSRNDVDAVLISSPAYTHAEFTIAALQAGKHVYCEKPVSPDVAGCRKLEQAAKQYDGKLSMTVGFQIRRASPYIELVKRIQSGAIGDLLSAELHYYSSGIPLKPKGTGGYDEARIRNQYKFRALSGGIFLDQAIHMIDVCNWTLDDKPLEATGIGGSKGALDFGDAWTNYQVLFKYAKGINVSVHASQVGPHFGDVCARFIGAEGIGEAHYSGGVFINGSNRWDSGIARTAGSELTEAQRLAGVFTSALHDADPNKGKSFIDSITSGRYINEIQSSVNSTLSAIMGRESATKGESITWDENYHSNAELPTRIDWSQFK